MPKIATNLIGAPPRYPGKLLKTGQTTQYSSELDDGYYETGLTKRYLILTTGQHSGVCTFTLDGKTETQSHNCVRDLVTGLMWARYTSAESASVGPGADGKMAWTGAADDIGAYCEAARDAELGGHNDWRVPNDVELASLRNMEAPNALPDPAAFPGWSDSYYWSSTTGPINTSDAMNVYFGHGFVYPHTKSLAFFAALVRGGV